MLEKSHTKYRGFHHVILHTHHVRTTQTDVSMAKPRAPTAPCAGKGVGSRKAPSLRVGMDAKGGSHFARRVGSFLQNQTHSSYKSSKHAVWCLPKGTEHSCLHKSLPMAVYNTFFIITKTWKPSRCPSRGE